MLFYWAFWEFPREMNFQCTAVFFILGHPENVPQELNAYWTWSDTELYHAVIFEEYSIHALSWTAICCVTGSTLTFRIHDIWKICFKMHTHLPCPSASNIYCFFIAIRTQRTVFIRHERESKRLRCVSWKKYSNRCGWFDGCAFNLLVYMSETVPIGLDWTLAWNHVSRSWQ